MARRPRLFGKQLYHHIYAWGNDRHPIFKDDGHYEKYLSYLASYSDCYKIDVIAYALMECHVHLFLFDSRGKISQFMDALHGNYAQFYNRVNKRTGHVFGERFNNKIVQPNNYGLWLSRYIHRQALEAGLVNDSRNYPWTSYLAYIGLSPIGFLKPNIMLEQFGHGKDSYRQYEKFVTGADDGPINWHKTHVSIIGDNEFVEHVQQTENKGENYEHDKKDLVSFVSSILSVGREILLNPRGWNERRLRHRAFSLLADEYGYSVSQIARAFNVTARAVIKALKN